MVTRVGTDGADTLVGTDDNDMLQGLGGDDLLTGGKGADVLDGGDGIDTAVYAPAAESVGVELDHYDASRGRRGRHLRASRTSSARPSTTGSLATPATMSSTVWPATTCSRARWRRPPLWRGRQRSDRGGPGDDHLTGAPAPTRCSTAVRHRRLLLPRRRPGLGVELFGGDAQGDTSRASRTSSARTTATCSSATPAPITSSVAAATTLSSAAAVTTRSPAAPGPTISKAATVSIRSTTARLPAACT